MYYIQSAASISHQHTFRNKGFSKTLSSDISTLIKPEYKPFINPTLIRRMSEILRMSVTCGKAALEDAHISHADGIITGTGLGCLTDTERFLNNVITIQEGILPPTSFIQSTHNTIAGQLSLALENRGYNMTHTQNSLSFEYALLDAMLMLNEEYGNLLVGAADEYIAPLTPVAEKYKLNRFQLTSGTGFFVLSDKPSSHTKAILQDVSASYNSNSAMIASFLKKNSVSTPGFILADGYNDERQIEIGRIFKHVPVISYTPLCGMFATSSAFALHLALDIINEKTSEVSGTTISNHQSALIINQLLPERTGLILIKNSEA